MNFKYYDVLSSLVLGYVFLVVLLFAFGIEYNSNYGLAYLSIAFIFGYMINSIGSLLERFYNRTIGGQPSERLLTIEKGENYSGYWRIKFYDAEECRNLLLQDVGDLDANNSMLFSRACQYAYSDKNSRVHDFNAQYAFSRSLLTTVLLSTIILIPAHYNDYRYYLLLVLLLISWNRFKERGYYFAKEVLTVYLRQKNIRK